MAQIFYIAAAAGAVAVYMMMPNVRREPGKGLGMAGMLLGLAALGGLLAQLAKDRAVDVPLPSTYYYIFTAISLAAAVRVITHSRPVYSALYFVLVVLSSAGMLVLLSAEFMAFAMVIIYGGAILVTYMFVIMLATLPQTAAQPQTAAVYDRNAREPVIAVAMGFALAAVIGSIAFEGRPIHTGGPAAARAATMQALAEMPRKIDPDAAGAPADRLTRELTAVLRQQNKITTEQSVFSVDLDRGLIDVREAPGARITWVKLDNQVIDAMVGNIDRVGLNLFKGHALGIELAGVILLLAMVGAITVSQRKVPREGESAAHA